MTPTQSISVFTNPTTGQIIKSEINNTTGKARFIAYILNKDLGVTGNLDILTISGTVLNSASVGSYSITYGALTSIAAVNESQNVLLGKTPLTLNVLSSTASSSPTASPTASPSPTATTVIYPAWDVDRDGRIGILDIGLVVDDYDSTNPVTPRADVDRNGTVDIVDIGIVIDHYE